jgi:hypothetical protein
MSSDKFSLDKGAEKAIVKEVPDFKFPQEKCKVILFTLMKNSQGKTVVDNAVSVPVGKSVDYRYN